jgi:hypothetical protein
MSESRRNDEYHRADPAYRKRMLILLAVVFVAGSLGLFGLRAWLAGLSVSLARTDPVAYGLSLQYLLTGICLSLAATLAGFGLWLHRVAKAASLERRWPPSSMRTTVDIPVKRLKAADAMASRCRVMAAVLGVCVFALCAWAGVLLGSVLI